MFSSGEIKMNEDILMQIENVKTYFPIKRGVFAKTVGHIKAVDDVSFTILKGETIGLVGESGCGKTTLGRSLIGLEKVKSGKINFKGTDLINADPATRKEFCKNIQLIFQDPFSSLNPRMTILDILTEGLIEHKLIEVSPEVDAGELLEEVGLNKEALYRYPHEFSGGQRQRIGIARAISLKPDLIICDESVSALDVSIQAQVLNLLMDLREKYKMSYLFISHDLSVIRQISHKIAVMYLGKIVEFGETDAIIKNPQHPYTKALISAVPVPGRPHHERLIMKGEVPSAANPPSGCRFHTRCPFATDICTTQEPFLLASGQTTIACHHPQ
jgi:oligopeptide/dipeptide ABC transporter ATP-binding protein